MLALDAAYAQFVNCCKIELMDEKTTPVVFSLDCENLVKFMNDVAKLPSEVKMNPRSSQYSLDLKKEMSSHSIVYEARELNQVADFLAKNKLPANSKTRHDK
ncbi:hypothetical protein CCACVL1_25525 [Corchorus capsularis]|uniref:RNase H type-1 domain-containing protein n=1 Tax=Corchorus capsularis TaxID=210143 RepID=A0A1R3GJJ6_COCAP|nr:hypothetical protein CCACVL1_25525 [Corchorus capsularis]